MEIVPEKRGGEQTNAHLTEQDNDKNQDGTTGFVDTGVSTISKIREPANIDSVLIDSGST